VVLEVVLGALALLAVALTMMIGRSSLVSATVSPLASVLVAAIYFILAYGVWGSKKWAWYCSLAFSAVGIIISVFVLFSRPRLSEVVSLVAGLAIIYLLIQPEVQQHFAIGSARLATVKTSATEPSGT
jgi:uncharacterized membrane protein (DUF2068 family)